MEATMSSGHASHKGAGVKQSHDTGQLDSAATTPVDNPEELLEEGEGYPLMLKVMPQTQILQQP